MLNTIGYEGAAVADLISTLQLAGVTCLVDIRDRAQSRKKGFSKTALEAHLEEAGIFYLHVRELGDPPEGREAARAGNYSKFRSIFLQVLDSENAQHALSAVEALLEDQVVCLLCYERDPHHCHRMIVAAELESRSGLKVRHLGVRVCVSPSVQGRRMRDLGQSTPARQ